MEFLHPPEAEPNRVVLVFVVAWNSQSRLIWYDWNGDMPLHQAQLRPNKIPLHRDEQLPLLLIPLMKNAAFILVCEKGMVLVKDIMTGDCRRHSQRLTFEQEPQEPGASQRRPIWVQWVRPMRSKTMRPNEEHIFLCREDGIVQYMVIDHGIKHMIDSNHNIGRLGVNINTSFATVDLGPCTADLLVAGGDESDGGLWDFPLRQKSPNQQGTMPNWTPISDFAVANVPIDRQNAGTAPAANNASKSQQRLFACCGRAQHGSISEVRYGVKASKKICTVGLHDDLKNGVLGIWALHGFYGNVGEQDTQRKILKDVTYIILSHPLRTHLLQLSLDQDASLGSDDAGLLEASVVLVGDDVGLDFSSKTIAAGRTAQGLTIQITETSIRATFLPLPLLQADNGIKEEDTEDREPDRSRLEHEGSQPRYMYPFADSHILAACIHTAEDKTTVVLAVQLNGHFYLELGTFATEYQPLDQRIPLHAQPSCLSLLAIEDEILILVGTLAGELEVYLPGDVVYGRLNTATTIHHTFAGPFGICDSIATLTRATTNVLQPLLVCGLRDGTIEILEVSQAVATCKFTAPLDFYRS